MIARRARRDGRFLTPRQPPADNTTVFGKYKTIHKPCADHPHPPTREFSTRFHF